VDDLFAASGLTPRRTTAPLRELGAYEALWMRDGTTFKSLARLFRNRAGALPSDFVAPAEADAHRDRALDLVAAVGTGSFEICVHGMPAYPRRLRGAAHPVELLYYQGRWELLSERCLAIVGTREPTRAGARRAAQLSRHFARAGFTVLSGLARGIDTVAHVAAIEAGGRTAAVLGTPLTACFPAENTRLQRQLARDYLVVSQVPILRYAGQSPDANRQFFRERNATLAALAEATIVVEAGERSGALIAARHALDQGRRVFILDSCFCRPDLRWPVRLAGRGAIRVGELAELESRLES
jgi:DNA processing protein